jgi:hypothetical protein
MRLSRHHRRSDAVIMPSAVPPEDQGNDWSMETNSIDPDRYYKGVAGEGIQQLADRLLAWAQQAELQDAHEAALFLADAATQLLDVGIEVSDGRFPTSAAELLVAAEPEAEEHDGPW